MLRRDFLKALSLSVSAAPLLSPFEVFGQDTTANSHVPTLLWAKRDGDEFRLDFSTSQGLRQIAWLLRDVRANVTGTPDFRLLQLMAWMQAWLAAYGHYVRIDFTSGLRTPETNKKIERAAQASYHLPDANMNFRAIDFKMKSIPSNYTGHLARYAAQGGVGFYPNDNFTHVDTGPRISERTGRERTWVDLRK